MFKSIFLKVSGLIFLSLISIQVQAHRTCQQVFLRSDTGLYLGTEILSGNQDEFVNAWADMILLGLALFTSSYDNRQFYGHSPTIDLRSLGYLFSSDNRTRCSKWTVHLSGHNRWTLQCGKNGFLKKSKSSMVSHIPLYDLIDSSQEEYPDDYFFSFSSKASGAMQLNFVESGAPCAMSHCVKMIETSSGTPLGSYVPSHFNKNRVGGIYMDSVNRVYAGSDLTYGQDWYMVDATTEMVCGAPVYRYLAQVQSNNTEGMSPHNPNIEAALQQHLLHRTYLR